MFSNEVTIHEGGGKELHVGGEVEGTRWGGGEVEGTRWKRGYMNSYTNHITHVGMLTNVDSD